MTDRLTHPTGELEQATVTSSRNKHRLPDRDQNFLTALCAPCAIVMRCTPGHCFLTNDDALVMETKQQQFCPLLFAASVSGFVWLEGVEIVTAGKDWVVC